MFSKKNIAMFLSGAAVFHALTHILLIFSGTLPLMFFSIQLDQNLNFYGAIVGSVIAAALLWWASSLKD